MGDSKEVSGSGGSAAAAASLLRRGVLCFSRGCTSQEISAAEKEENKKNKTENNFTLPPEEGPRVLVTVGSTAFEGLVAAAGSEPFLEALRCIGRVSLTVQVGRGKNIPFGVSGASLSLHASGVYVQVAGLSRVRVVRYIPSLSQLLQHFDLIISHCGAGTLIESLRASRRVVACVNPDLYNNHQLQLAVQLARGHHCVAVLHLADLPHKILEAWRRPLLVAPNPAATAAAGAGAGAGAAAAGAGAAAAAAEEAAAAGDRQLLLFVGGGDCLLLGDEGGFVSVFSLRARKAVSLLSPSSRSCLPFDPLTNPVGAAASAFSSSSSSSSNGSGSGTSSLLHIEPLASSSSSSSSSSRVLLQQRDSQISVFDLHAQTFAESFKTGAFSFCRCAAPQRSNSSSSSSSSSSCSSSSFGYECVAAPVGELESAGLFDLRALRQRGAPQGCVSPCVEFRMKRDSATESVFTSLLQQHQQQRQQQQQQQQEEQQQQQQLLSLPADISSCGTLQCVGFVSSLPLLLTAYELPVAALWDIRSSRCPLSLLLLPPADSPPAHLAVAGSRAWIACIEGPLCLQRIARSSRKRDTHAAAAAAAEAPATAATKAAHAATGDNETGSSNGNCSSSSRNNSSSSNSSSSSGSAYIVPVAHVRKFEDKSSSSSSSSSRSIAAALDCLEGTQPHITSVAVRGDGLLRVHPSSQQAL
ncbi:glycosyltransferase family 28 C-terminal domain-containing protein, putative [Eimeria mitis]|uniref:UDP-N-acetylglucosamine transferase subunit ALG13 n=1 Tax=Eimeria mitis TaxID=44415 RepID=U6KGW8_9EIME|nr:glycosyltransferase family 28 C-terminal domain-containing protein, putative [Eimeria mitis]CDJ35492.1 glycosyltransferase family 28 C-terminal domain-containing protein, putative [Eimeria mitis]